MTEPRDETKITSVLQEERLFDPPALLLLGDEQAPRQGFETGAVLAELLGQASLLDGRRDAVGNDLEQMEVVLGERAA